MKKCTICGEELPTQYAYNKHRLQVHPNDAGRRTSNNQPQQLSAYDKAIKAKQELTEAVRALESDRSVIQQRLLELDNMIAHYKKLL